MYFAYVLEKRRSGDEDLLQVATHHNSLTSLFDSGIAGCHLYYILSAFFGVSGDLSLSPTFQANTKVEISWNSEFAKGDKLHRGRIHFSEILGPGERKEDRWCPFARLQIWSVEEFGHLFLTINELSNEPSRSDRLDNNHGDVDSSIQPPKIIGYSEDSLGASASDHDSDSSSSQTVSEHEAATSSTSSSAIIDNFSSDMDPPTQSIHSESSLGSVSGSESIRSNVGGLEKWKTSNTGCDTAKGLAMQWRSRCRKNEDGRYKECNGGDKTWLPTGLLDVRQALATSVVRLVSPSDTPDAFTSNRRYITLSHCWGTWGPESIPSLAT